ncbi:MAG: M48 family metallopeptidase [Flavobacteriales bacterium]|jgi:predicted Zn-dependent protease|nr:M48 family metallopeptidase [Flavobacteriales bacterium]
MKNIKFTIVLALFLTACSTVPITGRKQLNLVSDAKIIPLAFTQYESFLKEHKLSDDKEETANLKAVGKRISAAVDKYMRANNMVKRANSYKWEFNLVQDSVVNAWAMPGGKVVFYTGILPITQDDDGIATVMGHEIAHAFARHGAERMSSGILQQAGGIAVALGTESSKRADIWNAAYGLGSQLGMLKFSRVQESEGDKLGLVFMIMAGYNPEKAIGFWQRMSENSKGKKQAEFLSTHPADDTRIADIKVWLPQAKEIAKKYMTAE